MIRAVIFDLDGCLVDSEPMALEVLGEEMAAEGAPTSAEELRKRFLGVSIQSVVDHITRFTRRAVLPDFPRRFEDRLLARYDTELRLIPGATALLDALQTQGIGMAIATGGSLRRLEVTLRVSGLERYFTGHAFSADQVRQGKPAPDLFLFAARNLGIDPSRCAVMEDSPHGIAGARAAGMRAVGFVGGSHLSGMRDDHAVHLRKAGAAEVLKDLTGMRDALLSGC